MYKSGEFLAFLAFLIWGLMPLYWRQLHDIDPILIVSHRILWGSVWVCLYLLIQGRFQEIKVNFHTKRNFLSGLASGFLIAINWYLFIWAIASGRVIESALGYYLSPIVNILLGVFLLGEKVKKIHWVVLCLCLLGVSISFWAYGSIPILALTLALSFGFYSVLKKKTRVAVLPALAFETWAILPFSIAWLWWRGFNTNLDFQVWDIYGKGLSQSQVWLLLGTGIVTALPLALYSESSKKISLITLGIFQLLGPTLQFSCGVFIFRESIKAEHKITMAFFIFAYLLYLGQTYLRPRIKWMKFPLK